jgi:hypothetical protein
MADDPDPTVRSDDDLSHFSVEHRVRRLKTADLPSKAPTIRRRVLRDVVLLGCVVVAFLVVRPFADVKNPDYPEARALADQITSVYRSFLTDETSVAAAAASEGLVLFEQPVDGIRTLIATHQRPTTAGTCYALRFGGGLATVAMQFAPTEGCIPTGPAVTARTGLWGDVLPSERLTTAWFIPMIVVLCGCALVLTTDIVLATQFR